MNKHSTISVFAAVAALSVGFGTMAQAGHHHYPPHRDLYVALDVVSVIADILAPRTIYRPTTTTTYVQPTTTYVQPTTTYVNPATVASVPVANVPVVNSVATVQQPSVVAVQPAQPVVVQQTSPVVVQETVSPVYVETIPRYRPYYYYGPRWYAPYYYDGPRWGAPYYGPRWGAPAPPPNIHHHGGHGPGFRPAPPSPGRGPSYGHGPSHGHGRPRH